MPEGGAADHMQIGCGEGHLVRASAASPRTRRVPRPRTGRLPLQEVATTGGTYGGANVNATRIPRPQPHET